MWSVELRRTNMAWDGQRGTGTWFYADDGRIVRKDNEWVQDAREVLVEMVRRMGLETNIEKSKTMVYRPG